MARVSPRSRQQLIDASASDDEEVNAEVSKSSARQISQASTTFSLEELSSPDFFSRQCLEIDSLACRVAEESSINQAMMTAAVSNRNFCVTVANPRHLDIPLIAVSEKFEAMTGHSRAEMLGKSCRILNDGCSNDLETIVHLRSACRTGSAWTGVLTNQRKSGELFLNLLDLHGLTVATSRRTGEPLWFLIGIHSDVTEEAEVAGGELPRGRVEQIHEVANSIRSKLTEDFSRMAVSGALLANLEVSDADASAEEWVLLPTPAWGVHSRTEAAPPGAPVRAPQASLKPQACPPPTADGRGAAAAKGQGEWPPADQEALRTDAVPLACGVPPAAACLAGGPAAAAVRLLAGAACLACVASAVALSLRRRAVAA